MFLLIASNRYQHVNADICDAVALKVIFDDFQPDIVMHLAAESRVDRSINGPAEFIQTNILELTSCSKSHGLTGNHFQKKKAQFLFHHVSTDEVYGDLEGTDDLFLETTAYKPSSPYSASKASSDHLVRAWHRTYGLPIVVTNSSNNYGQYQFLRNLSRT